jgi:hypothetical protein
MRFAAPMREQTDPEVFSRPPLAQWREFAPLLCGAQWPDIGLLNARVRDIRAPRFVPQTPALLADGLHYEQRIAAHGQIATRERNWHDLLNALIWLRFPQIKSALNTRQVAEIECVGTKQRTRAQYALTHFDEGGIIVVLRDPALLPLWDAHDWHGLFWRERKAWSQGAIEAIVFGHALLEHALRPHQLLVGKALVVAPGRPGNTESVAGEMAAAIRSGTTLNDPQELRPLPLSGIPGWHVDNETEAFYREAPCFRPLRAGRRYPPAASPAQAVGESRSRWAVCAGGSDHA